ELRALLRHPGEVHRHDHRRRADRAAHGLDTLSCGRGCRVIHSSQVTGRIGSSPSISSAVATLVAIMQNASCGVRTWIACQLRFSTSTIVLFRMSFMCLHTATALCTREVFVLCCFRWLLSSLNHQQ